MIYALYDEKVREIEQLKSKLTKTVESANSEFLKLNAQVPYSIEAVNNTCNEKMKQLDLLRDELIEKIEIANSKYEKLKSFQ